MAMSPLYAGRQMMRRMFPSQSELIVCPLEGAFSQSELRLLTH